MTQQATTTSDQHPDQPTQQPTEQPAAAPPAAQAGEQEPTARPHWNTIKIRPGAWLESRTGGEVPELADTFGAFTLTADDTAEHPHMRGYDLREHLDLVELFITARAGAGWARQPYARVDTLTLELDNYERHGGCVGLDYDMSVWRYTDPEHGRVAVMLWHHDCAAACEPPQFLADYTTDPAEWTATDEVDITCPSGHRWRHRRGQVTDHHGTTRPVADVFPDGMVRYDPTWPSGDRTGTEPEPWIPCPACGPGAVCAVALPQS